jgi:hypothetical protein
MFLKRGRVRVHRPPPAGLASILHGQEPRENIDAQYLRGFVVTLRVSKTAQIANARLEGSRCRKHGLS